MRTCDLTGLRKVQPKFVLWFILGFFSYVFYYTSWQRTCSEEEKKKKSYMFFSLFHFLRFWCEMTEIPARLILTALKGCATHNRNCRTQQGPPSPWPLCTQTSQPPASMAKKPMFFLYLMHCDFGEVGTLISYSKSLISFL